MTNSTARASHRLCMASHLQGSRRYRSKLEGGDTAVNRRGSAAGHWHRRALHIGFVLGFGSRPPAHQQKTPLKIKGREEVAMEQIRVCTYDGPGAQPVIRSVPWPKIPKKAALIKVGACGVCGTDLHILKIG